MDNFAISIKSAVALLGTFITYFLGGYDAILEALIVFVVLDYITGVSAAAAEGQLNSETGFLGIFKKLTIFILVAVAHLIDGIGVFAEPIFRSVVIWFYLANEGISILENAVRLGLPIPDTLVQALESLKEKGGKNYNG